VQLVAGVDLGGTAINYTLVNREEQFLIEGLCEHPALSKQGPEICLQQIVDGLKIAADQSAEGPTHKLITHSQIVGHGRLCQRARITHRGSVRERIRLASAFLLRTAQPVTCDRAEY
jgi:N-acetylglucosamine kinase-like BadF-type ATPase